MGKKIVFIGTPSIACPFLKELVECAVEITAVITMPDNKAGRGLIPVCPAVKNEGLKLNIPVYQPFSCTELDNILEMIRPDLAVVVAYGKILKKKTLDLVPLGFLNAHFSILPSYRGAAPVRRSILNGEKKTGITIFKLDEGMDTGPVVLTREIEIGENENTLSLLSRLSEIGKKAMAEAVSLTLSGKAIFTPQSGQPSYAPKIEVKDTFVDFSIPASKVYDYARAFCFDPRARFFSPGIGIVQIISMSKCERDFSCSFGRLAGFEKGKGIFVKCGEGAVFIEKIKPEGKKEINAYDFFVNGKRMKEGDLIVDERR